MNDEEEILTKELIMSLEEPAVFQNRIDDWPVLKWSLKDWKVVLGDKPLPFRCGVKCCSSQAFWESKCSEQKMTIEEFASLQTDSNGPSRDNKWFYFDYKRIPDWIETDKFALMSIKWNRFGLPDVDAIDSNIWIASRGAHTPCHFDTYGCNLVAQVFGTKRWVLFPPSEMKNMKPTRIPYEESSVYSQWNFACPLPSDFYSGFDGRVFIIDLKPGDVLYVPRHWWHYVESLDSSISINTWLPMDPEDDFSRMDEALTQFLMSQVSRNMSALEKRSILNPNECSIDSLELHDSTNIISHCVSNIKKSIEYDSAQEPPLKQPKVQFLNQNNLALTVDIRNATVSCSSSAQLKQLMDEKCCCLSEENHQSAMYQDTSLASSTEVQSILDAFCHPDVVVKVRENLLMSYNLPLKRY